MRTYIDTHSLQQRLSKFALLALLLAATSIAHASQQNLAAMTKPIPASVSVHNQGTQVIISTANEQWQVSLEAFSMLGDDASAQRALYDLPYFYRGNIPNKANSWVRLMSDVKLANSESFNATGSNLTGHIFIGDQLLKLEYDEKTGHSLMASPETQASMHNFQKRYKSQQESLSDISAISEKRSPVKAIKIGIMADSRYNEVYNGRGLAEALSVINGVDGLFQDQLGLAIIVDRFKSITDPDNDPLRHYSGSMENMLSEFREVRKADAEFPADLALVHLFTGHSDANELIGVSWIDTLCQMDGHDVSISTPYPYSILLSAHEIAHNLGALHDDDLQCLVDSLITGTEVMWSELSHTTQTRFSSCSLNRMKQSLESSCVQDNIDVAVSLKTAPTSFMSQQTVEISAINWDSARPSGRVSSITRFPDATQLINPMAGCVVANTTMTCQHGEITGYSQSTYSVTALLPNSNPALISSELYFSEFSDSNQSDNSANVQVSFTGEAMSQVLQPNSFDLSNDGNNRTVATGGGSGLGSLGPLLGLLFLCSACYRHSRNRKPVC